MVPPLRSFDLQWLVEPTSGRCHSWPAYRFSAPNVQSGYASWEEAGHAGWRAVEQARHGPLYGDEVRVFKGPAGSKPGDKDFEDKKKWLHGTIVDVSSFGAYTFREALGLKWRRIGDGETRPSGRALVNDKLAQTLLQKDKKDEGVELLTPKEWGDCGITGLRVNDWINARSACFTPAPPYTRVFQALPHPHLRLPEREVEEEGDEDKEGKGLSDQHKQHKAPAETFAENLAWAGFYYAPTLEQMDRCVCFACQVCTALCGVHNAGQFIATVCMPAFVCASVMHTRAWHHAHTHTHTRQASRADWRPEDDPIDFHLSTCAFRFQAHADCDRSKCNRTQFDASTCSEMLKKRGAARLVQPPPPPSQRRGGASTKSGKSLASMVGVTTWRLHAPAALEAKLRSTCACVHA